MRPWRRKIGRPRLVRLAYKTMRERGLWAAVSRDFGQVEGTLYRLMARNTIRSRWIMRQIIGTPVFDRMVMQ